MRDRIDGREWLEQVRWRLLREGQTWTKGRIWGDAMIPVEGLILHEPLVLDMRLNVRGGSTQISNHRTIEVAEDFPMLQPAVRWEDSPSQGNFTQQLYNVSVHCRGRADGVRLTGDQGSHYENVLVEDPAETGIYCYGLTHGASLVNCGVRCTPEGVPLRGRGMMLKDCSAVSLLGTSIHRCAVGFQHIGTATVWDIGTSYERVGIPWDLRNAVNVRSSGHHMLHTTEDGCLGHLDDCEVVEVAGTLRKGQAAQTWVRWNGGAVSICGQSNRNDPKTFRRSW